MHLPNGHTFTVVAERVGRTSLCRRGDPQWQAAGSRFLRHAEILAGGELHFTMQAAPNKRLAGRAGGAAVLDVALRDVGPTSTQ